MELTLNHFISKNFIDGISWSVLLFIYRLETSYNKLIDYYLVQIRNILRMALFSKSPMLRAQFL